MSANNEILIRKVMYRWEVRDVDTDAISDYGIEEGTNKKVGEFDNLEEAVDAANKYMEECVEEGSPVEYGLHIIKP